MDFPRFPDWLIYLAASSAILVAAVGRQEHADTPEPPPPPPGSDSVPLGPGSPFEPATVIRAGAHRGQHRGTAFAVAEGGVWLTATSEVAGCRRVALKVAEGRAVGARVEPSADAAISVLRTAGGPSPLALSAAEAKDGRRAFLLGFPKGEPGEAAVLLMTRAQLNSGKRAGAPIPAQLWSEIGRTDGMDGALPGLAGAPVLGADGKVIGMVLAHDPRHARFYSTTLRSLGSVLGRIDARPAAASTLDPLTVENYGRVGDDLRRDRRIAQVLCLLG
jgi:hypothetical protein